MKKIFTFIFTLICATLLVSCGEDELKDKVASATMHDKDLITTIANYKVDGDRLETWMEGDNYHKVFKKR